MYVYTHFIYIYKTEYYSVLKRKKNLPRTTTWMNLDDVTLSEINQSQKDKYCTIHLYEVPEVAEFIETESRMVITMGWGDVGMGS